MDAPGKTILYTIVVLKYWPVGGHGNKRSKDPASKFSPFTFGLFDDRDEAADFLRRFRFKHNDRTGKWRYRAAKEDQHCNPFITFAKKPDFMDQGFWQATVMIMPVQQKPLVPKS